ncbi:CDT1-like protein a, chloroplastic isoform X2 [Corylus avellana]|uniref:CDT1-like protein a, chloroplastic isoform X2 n=1 Tax=Corylus avellana TaxID=13451 RepID=UPI00286A8793|nr:CDT1-like protein a, chloroplastic isoform X2 [Corylus avellana]
MDQRICEEDRQLDFKCKKILHRVEKSTAVSPAHVQKPGILATQNLELKIACQTPEKTNEPLHTKFKDGDVNLPDKFKIISEFFDGMNCSFRLLSLCKRLPTFQNISAQVEVLKKRKFMYSHLAQIKYILPEAIQIEKILVHDKKTLCMKPDMKIGLQFDVVKGHSEYSDFLALQQLFASRLLSFLTKHPQAYDVPEAMLPEPFSQQSQILGPEQLTADSFIESQSTSIECEALSEKFHLYPSLTRHFSQKAVGAETEKTQPLASPVPLLSVSSNSLINQESIIGQQRGMTGVCSKFDGVTNQNIESGQHKESPATCSVSTIVNSPIQQIKSSSTPIGKLGSFVDCLMLQTPAQLTPRRSMPSCEDKLKTPTSQKLTSCEKPAKRALDFSGLEHNKSELDSIVSESGCKNAVHDDILHTKEGIFKDGNVAGSLPLLQEVKEGLCCFDDVCQKSQTGVTMSHSVSSCLPELVALIHHIFKSVNCLSITKEELVHKIIINSFDIVERREVEEQIELLERLVPDWIYRKLTTGGEIMYSIKKVPDLDSVRARLST